MSGTSYHCIISQCRITERSPGDEDEFRLFFPLGFPSVCVHLTCHVPPGPPPSSPVLGLTSQPLPLHPSPASPPPPVPPLRSGVFKARRQKSTASLQLVKYRFYCLWDLACRSVHFQRYDAHSHTAGCVCARAVSHGAASTLKRSVFHSAFLPFVITLSCLAAVKRQGEAISER